MKQYLYFAYGLNTNVNSMAHRCPASVSHGYAKLVDHTFRFAGPADVVKYKGSFVHGVLWTITDECLASLDILEGYPYFYNRRHRPVWFNGRVVHALVYFMQPGNLDSPPSSGYFDMVEEGYRDHGVPVDQLYHAREASRDNCWLT
jgi:gamma-glutamylcyclotransferase (GGCT)/AIG2-like uncharacterized protein YtfP